MANIPRFLKYVFPVSVNTEIALVQTTGGAASMLLNGLYADPTGVNGGISLLTQGFSAAVSLTSVNDNSGVDFIINGYQNGVFITETIIGPNNNTVQTMGIYDTVTSITTSAAINAVSSGIGNKAFFKLIEVDPHAIFGFYGIQIYCTVGQVSGVMWGTIDKIINNGLTYQDMMEAEPNGPLYETNQFNTPLYSGNFDAGANYIVSINTQSNQAVTLVFKQAA